MRQQTVAEGFELYPSDGGFNDAIAPLYLKVTPSGTLFGLQVEKQHCNPMGICHGAVYMTLMELR